MTQPTSPSKPFWQSTTLQGVLVSMIGQVLSGLEAAGVIPAGVGAAGGTLLGTIVTGIGLVVTIIGRFKAKGPITIS